MAKLKIGQKTCTGAAVQVSPTPPETAYWLIKALSSNGANVELGFSDLVAGAGFVLEPGDYIEYASQRTSGEYVFDTELSQMYVLGAAGDKVAWLAHQV